MQILGMLVSFSLVSVIYVLRSYAYVSSSVWTPKFDGRLVNVQFVFWAGFGIVF